MGRPRSKSRMSRMVQARVTDEQYDYLADRAFHVYEGDLSAALRASITFSQHFEDILGAADPGEAVRQLKDRWEQESFDTRASLRMDKPGEGEGGNED